MINLSPGPSALPQGVRQRIADEIGDWRGTGTSVMEVSHRAAPFMAFAEAAEARLRRVLGISSDRSVLFLQGGASAQFALVPLNLRDSVPPRYAVDGHWGRKAHREAGRLGPAAAVERSEIANEPGAYLHVTSNETIEGLQWHDPPRADALIVADMSSDIGWGPVDLDAYDLVYASAQKNLGVAGVTVVIASPRALARSPESLPTQLNYAALAAARSMSNTPPTFSWYVLDLVVRWMEHSGGVEAMGERNRSKARVLYDALDASSLFTVDAPEPVRSCMNVVFRCADAEQDARFLAAASAEGFVGLKGHRAVGGLRASLYNAIEPAEVAALVEFLREFERRA